MMFEIRSRHTLFSAALVLSILGVPALAQSNDPGLAQKRQAMDDRYTIGPSAAGGLGYRIAWQAAVDKQEGELRRVDVIGEDVFVLAPRNRMTRLDRANGKPIWTSTVADALDTVWGVTPGPATSTQNNEKIYVTTDPVIMVIDHATGAVVGRQDLERIPSTQVVRFGNHLVFGTRSGQIVWHQYLVGHAWKANQLKGPIQGTPIRIGDTDIGVASIGGTLLIVDGRNARRVWGANLFDGVYTHLATGQGFVIAASRDQYLWAFDAGSGEVRWRYFTESPLNTPPSVIGDRVLQWVPSEGLVCLQLNPGDAVEGHVLWTIPDASGTIVGAIRGDALLFDNDSKTLRLIDMKNGAVRKSFRLPKLRSIQIVGDQIYALGTGSTIQRLDPIH